MIADKDYEELIALEGGQYAALWKVQTSEIYTPVSKFNSRGFRNKLLKIFQGVWI